MSHTPATPTTEDCPNGACPGRMMCLDCSETDTPTTDPLKAFSGHDRILRDCIENVIFKATVGGEMPSNWRGTLWLANEIMAHVKAAT